MNDYIKKIIYLGPDGSNSQFACKLFMQKTGIKAVGQGVSTITKAIEILDLDPDNSLAILPVENSIEGVVRETVDNLVKTNPEVFIQAEISLPICHCLVSTGTKEEIKTIASINQAIAQCRGYITKNFKSDIGILLYSSTSGAAQFAKEKGGQYAAIASELCAEIYGLNILEKNINDVKDNKTRFIAACKKKLDFGENSRTSIAFTVDNKPGALLNVLEIFKKHELNLIYLESRPSKKKLGEYIFYADIDRGFENIKDTLEEIKVNCTFTRLLGSYSVL
ncbi:MAG: prephenate dehydratase [Candidatus Gastranaerophilales bacterium]|nr:prephenate dehydratase [Candidatus Gastranaerophilales bacterium]